MTLVAHHLIMPREMMFASSSLPGNNSRLQYRVRVKSETDLQLARVVRRASCRFRRYASGGSIVVAKH
ncbi:hypothetical protein OHA21_44075 [Actinoplanes sp. NBC_00393]|uniref:hypothetical protein n=1 Tax=Actinoplanes sp. NBC_00393 TaxID=2975953 RepID=UPI002E24FDA5